MKKTKCLGLKSNSGLQQLFDIFVSSLVNTVSPNNGVNKAYRNIFTDDVNKLKFIKYNETTRKSW